MADTKQKTTHYDVVVIGGGAVGLSFSCSLEGSGLRVLVLEKQEHDKLENPPFDGRDLAHTHLSKKILEQMGVWNLIPSEEIAPLRHAQVFDGNSAYALEFGPEGKSVEQLGHLISNNVIRKAVYDRASKMDHVEIRTEAEVKKLNTSPRGAFVELADGERIECDLIVAADNRFSATRRMMGVSTDMLDFGRTAIVFRMTHEKTHQQTAWECFRYGRTLALLPLNSNESSVVMTINFNLAPQALAMSETELENSIREGFGNRFGKMTRTSELHTYPLMAVHAKRFFKTRYVLLGDAAVGMHPVTAHGFNLGLRGQNTLATEIKNALADGKPFYEDAVLSRYQRQQMLASRPIYHGTNQIVQLFTNETIPAKLARKAMLRFGNHFKPVQWAITHKLTETDGLFGFGGISSMTLPTLPSLKMPNLPFSAAGTNPQPQTSV